MKICVIFGGAASDNIKSFYVKDGTMYDFKHNKPHIFEAAMSPQFVTQIWNELELYAVEQLVETGIESWPEHPLSVLGRTRNVIITFQLGIPDEDNEWQFDGTNIYHRRRNNEIWYFIYNRTTFSLSEQPTKL